MPIEVEQLGRGSDTEEVYADMLIYGRSGAGKTHFGATAPGPAYLLGPDKTGHKAVPYPIDGKVVRKLDDARDAINGFYQGGHGYKTLIIDGLTFFHDLYTFEIGQDAFERKKISDPDRLTWDERGKIFNQYKKFIAACTDLTQHPNPADRVHVIFTTLEERIREADNAEFNIRPKFGTKGMNEDFAAAFSIIAYVRPSGRLNEDGTIDPTRHMLFTEYNGILARDRLDVFPQMGDNVNLSEYLH